jgi:seryl-tRNA synthetase
MLQTRKIRENKAEYIKLLKIKNFDANNIFNLLIDLDDQRKEAQIKCDELLSKSNNLSSQIGKLYKTGDTNKVASLKKESIIIKD